MKPLLILEQVLRQGRISTPGLSPSGETWGLRHAVARLVRALDDADFSLDHAVLLRQCLRLLRPGQSVVVETVSPDVEKHFEVVGVRRVIDGTVEALPFSPTWLAAPAPWGVDVPATACVLSDESLPAEAWLGERLGKYTWRSQAQREAAWNALTAPSNSTLLVGLPTGAGKSLVYQVCAAFEPGLTVVVVPTVALGLDQIKALRAMPIAETHNPLLYTADEHAATVLEAVRTRQCRLLITSPEAIVAGRLGEVLRTFAQEAWLRRLVIDEAHIVNSWGASFRVEFQLLGAHLNSWRVDAPQGVRTLLLSATFGPETPSVLRTLFAGDNVPWEEYVIQRLRPEIHYFSPGRALDVQDHDEAATQALLRLPRPAILYVTERKEAEKWVERLRLIGLKRIECFHGMTSQPERNRILDAWRDDRLDLVVATSAFGLGVDKADVRAVVHACFPENVDRYYQEVGRGGRDGAASVAVALWTEPDRAIGGSMGPKLLKDEAKIRGRWAAMWHHREVDETGALFKVPVWVAPDYKLHERTYDESVTWNKRLLLMMQRAELLQVVGMAVIVSEDKQDRREWVTLQMKCGTTNLEARLPGLLHRTRTAELDTLDAARSRLDDLLSNCIPTCRILRDHYGRATYRACGSCASCRHEPGIRAGTMPLHLRLQSPLTRPRVDVVHGPSPNSTKEEGHIIMALRRVLQEGLSGRFVTEEHFHDQVKNLLDKASAQGDSPYRLDLLARDSVNSIRPDEVVVCLYNQALHPHAALLNVRGKLCAHWILGASSEEPSGNWPFLHEHQSRLYRGPEALNDWITSRLELRSHQRVLDSVHR
jgi:ATP-dependent DNA helicase RecQ